MDISKWPMDQIMQLPDHCFGRRVVYTAGFRSENAGTVYDMCRLAFPERVVIWSIQYKVVSPGLDGWMYIGTALSDVLPTTTAEFDALEPLLPYFGILDGLRWIVPFWVSENYVLDSLRNVCESKGRKLIVRAETYPTVLSLVVSVTASSIPREVPDCLISG